MRKRKNIYFDESTIEFVEDYKNKNRLPSFTSALTSIVDEYRNKNNIPATELLVKGIAREVKNELSDTLTRIRLGSNNADRNSDIIIMLINSLIAYQKFTSLVTDDTPQLAKAKEIEKARIANFRQRKLERSKEKADKKISPKQQEDDNTIENIVDDDLIV